MTDTVTQPTLDVRDLPIDDVLPNEANIRSDLGDLGDLVDSIRSIGVLEPCIVHPNDTGTWTLIAGHRRRAAAVDAGLEQLPCVVRSEPDEVTLAEMMLAENTHRAALDPIDEAQALLRIKASGKYKRLDDIAQRVHRSKEWVAGRLKLLTLPEDVWPAVRTGTLGVTDAVAIAGLDVDDDAKATLAGRDPGVRANEIRRCAAEAAGAERLAELEAEYGPLRPIGQLHQIRQDHPWGVVRLGDGPGELNVPVGLHRHCDGHLALRTNVTGPDVTASAWCTRPLEHLTAGDFTGPAAKTKVPAKAQPVAGFEWGWEQKSAHIDHCPRHQVLDLPWDQVAVCTDPTLHTNETRKGYLAPNAMVDAARAARGPRRPGDPLADDPQWQPSEDARRLLTERIADNLEVYRAAVGDPAVLDMVCIDWCPPDLLADHIVDVVDGWLSAVARAPGDWTPIDPTSGRANDQPSIAALEFAFQACIDVGDPPPTLDQIRTRIDVITRGEHHTDTPEDTTDA